MSCSTTTAMYLGVSTEICVSGSASRSGNTVTISGTFSVSQGSQWNWNAIYAYIDGKTSWTKVKPYNRNGGGTWYADFSFSFDTAYSGSDTYTAIFQVWNDAETQTVGNSASTSFWTSWGEGSTTPAQPNVSIVEVYDTGAKFHVTGDYGIPSSASGRYIEAAILNQNTYGSTYRFNTASDTTSADITVTNSTYRGGSLNIQPNKQYWYGGYISNTQKNNSRVSGQFVTKAANPEATFTNIDGTAIDLAWSTAADGGYYTKTVGVSLDGTNYTTLGTYSDGNAHSGYELIDNLTPNTAYSIRVRSATTAGNSVSTTSRTTLPAEPTLSVTSQTINSITIGYAFDADGGAYSKTLAYTIDGGVNWVQAATISGGSAASGTFTISNLQPGHAYNLITRVTTGAGTITLDDMTISTLSDKCKIYGSVQKATGYSFSYSNLSDTNNIIGEGN